MPQGHAVLWKCSPCPPNWHQVFKAVLPVVLKLKAQAHLLGAEPGAHLCPGQILSVTSTEHFMQLSYAPPLALIHIRHV
jgi:hypothetical protein